MKFIFALIRFSFLSAIKIFAMIFYRIEFNVIGRSRVDWSKVKIILVLNHTSLYEPIYSHVIPFSFLWRMSRHLVFPIADVTSQKFFTGFLFDLMAPKAVPISRKRDDTWDHFMNEVRGESVVILAPEGRMKRPDGFDKNGEPMTVRGGFYDILKCIPDGDLLLVYSGGLHHVHSPGDRLPTIFKTLKVNMEQVSAVGYLKQFEGKRAKLEMIKDLERRRDLYCPRADMTPWRTGETADS